MIIEGTRLNMARLRKGLKKKELAERVGITQRALRNIEAGESEPNPDTLEALEKVLGFSRDFLANDPMEMPSLDTVSFRALSKMSAVTRDSALSAGALGELVVQWMDSKFHLPPTDLPDLGGIHPEQAANKLRAEWNVGDRPIKHLLARVESKGVRVLSLEEKSLDVDAFCFWRDNTPLVFLNTMKSAERTRFDLAHELGHLVLHRAVGFSSECSSAKSQRKLEEEANRFASALLMPATSVALHAPRSPTMKGLIKAKKHWGVSVMALIYRMHQLGALTDWQHRQLTIEASRLGYRTCEPEPMDHETSKLLTKVYEAMRGRGLSLQSIADDLGGIPREQIETLFLRLAIVSIEGGRSNSSSSPKPRGFEPKVIEGGAA